MPKLFKFEQSDFAMEADFAEPHFGLFQEFPAFASTILQGLKPQGLGVSDMRWESATGLGEVNFHCFLFNFGATVRVDLQKVETRCGDLRRVDRSRVETAAVEAIRALKRHARDLRFRGYTCAQGFHGAVEGRSAREFLETCNNVSPREGLGPPVGVATVLYFGPSERKLSSMLTLDLSAVVSGGVFIRIAAVFDGAQVEPHELPELFAAHKERVWRSLDLTVDAGSTA